MKHVLRGRQFHKTVLLTVLAIAVLCSCGCGRGGHTAATPVPADPAPEGNLALLPSAAVSCSVPTLPSHGTDQLSAASAGTFLVSTDSSDFTLTYSLGLYTQVKRIDLYPASEDGYIGRYFPHCVTVSVSADGKNYTEVTRYRNIDVPESVPVLEFAPAYAAYVRLTFSELEQENGAFMCELAAVELISAAGEYPYPEE